MLVLLALTPAALGARSGSAPTNFTTGPLPFAVAVGDLDLDRQPDLVVANHAGGSIGGSVSVLLGSGDGSFHAVGDYNAGAAPTAVAIADFNGDTVPDLAVANEDSANVAELIGTNDAMFGAEFYFPVGSPWRPRTSTATRAPDKAGGN